MKILWGTLSLLLGLTLLGWICYNYFIEMQPSAEGRNPLVPVLFSGALIFVGVKRLFFTTKQSESTD